MKKKSKKAKKAKEKDKKAAAVNETRSNKLLRSNKELRECHEKIGDTNKFIFKHIEQDSLELHNEMGAAAYKAKQIVKADGSIDWETFTRELYNKERQRIDESIALHVAVKVYRHKDPKKPFAPWMCKTNMQKAGQMIDGETKEARLAAKKLLKKGEVTIKDKKVKANTLKPMDVLTYLCSTTKKDKTTSTEETAATATSELKARLKEYIKVLKGIKEFFIKLRNIDDLADEEIAEAEISNIEKIAESIQDSCQIISEALSPDDEDLDKDEDDTSADDDSSEDSDSEDDNDDTESEDNEDSDSDEDESSDDDDNNEDSDKDEDDEDRDY